MSDTIKIQEKGIALCHEAQGFSANKRPISLLMKSDLERPHPCQKAVDAFAACPFIPNNPLQSLVLQGIGDSPCFSAFYYMT